jgi:hypothetical protein
MNRIRPIASAICALLSLAFIAHESIHFYRYRHFAPLALHADVLVTTSNDILGVEGTGKIYQARLTNYGIFPTRIIGCDYTDWASRRQTMLNYIVERRHPNSARWEYVPESDESGSRKFCQDVFEVNGTHRAPHWLWPGQTMQFGEIIPAQMGGFRIGDDGRYTIFLAADGNGLNSLSTHPFRVDQEPPKHPVPVQLPRP